MDARKKKSYQSESLQKLTEMTTSVVDHQTPSVLQKMTAGQVQISPNNNNNNNKMTDSDDVIAKSHDGRVTVRREINDNDIHSLPSGLYGWTDIDGIKLPYLLRGLESFVSVRMVERLYLSRYPNKYPDEIKRVGPLVSHYASVQESALMNEIDHKHGKSLLNNERFSTDELLVKLDQFSKFYTIVKNHFDKQTDFESVGSPSSVVEASSPSPTEDNSTIGWIQLNNTVVPFVRREQYELLPVSVVKYSTKLLSTLKPRTIRITKPELECLNKACAEAGLTFTFTMKCKMVKLQRLKECEAANIYCATILSSDGNPFEKASYISNGADNADVETTSRKSTMSSDTKQDTLAIVNAAVEAAKQRHTVTKPESTPSPKLPTEHIIKPLSFEGRAVSCLIKPSIDEAFALIEAVAKLYFPTATITDLQIVLIEQLQIPLYTLSKTEEMAFINFYGLPTDHLKCNKAISLNYLQKCVNQLRAYFNNKSLPTPPPLKPATFAATEIANKRKESIRSTKMAVDSIKAKIQNMQRKRKADAMSPIDLRASQTPSPLNNGTSHTIVPTTIHPAFPTSIPVFPSSSPVFPRAELSPSSSEQSLASTDRSISPAVHPPRQKRRLEDTVSLLRLKAQAKQ